MMAEDPDHSDYWPVDDSGHESVWPGESRTFFSTWGWPLCGLAAFVIFELTASLVWSSLVFALRFGWKDAYAGWFFWWRDSSLARGWALLLMHVSSATSKVFLTALVMIMSLLILAGQQGRQIPPDIEALLNVIGLVFCGGMLASGLFCAAAVFVCRWNDRKVWVDRMSYQLAMSRKWPQDSYTSNRCNSIVFFAMIPATGLFLVLTMMVPLALILDRLARDQAIWILLLFIVPIFGSVFFFFWGRDWATETVEAGSPQECWPELVNSDEIGESDLR
jgi:hypothetical protein